MSWKTIRLAALLWLSSLVAGIAALLLAEFGAPRWAFVLLLAWLLTVGLPTLAAVLVLAAAWPGPSIGTYGVAAALLAFVFQLAAVQWARRALENRRSSP